LGLAAWAIPVLFFAAQALLAYGNGVPFFVFELALKPLHNELAAHLSDEVEGEALSLPLRRRLLAAVSAISVATGIIAVGLRAEGHPGLDELGLATLVALGVSFTILLPFTLLLAGSVVAPIHRLQEATARVGRGDLAIRVPVTAHDEIGALTRAFNRMVSGLQERERLRDAFGAFVDPELADRVAREGTDLQGEELEVSVLFLDVRGFTSLSESAAAKDVVGRLNELYDQVVPVILRHGGHANKFIGDGLLAVFGAPVRHPDHADRAVAAALETARDVPGAIPVPEENHLLRRQLDPIDRADMPIIFITGYGDVPTTVRAMRAGAVEFLTKPFGDEVLLQAVRQARIASRSLARRPRGST
jgi:HAMP domain-containing protein